MNYRIVAVERDGRWLAHAQHHDTGRRFGAECAGATQAEATDRLARWLEWQHEHSAALDALQAATRGYHRAVAGTFASDAGDALAATLAALDAARTALDHIRSRRPEQSG